MAEKMIDLHIMAEDYRFCLSMAWQRRYTDQAPRWERRCEERAAQFVAIGVDPRRAGESGFPNEYVDAVRREPDGRLVPA